MIKKLLFLLFPGFLFSQHFSGEIEYRHTIMPKSPTVDVDSIREMKQGEKSVYVITENNYKNTYFKNGNPTYSYTYSNVSKRMYDNHANRNFITYRDSRKTNAEYKKSIIHKDSIKEVLGRKCFMVEYNSSYGKTKTYYSNDVRVNYESFKEHKVGNWYEKLKDVNGCLSLKSITEHEDYFEIIEAVKITERKVDKDEFNTPTEKIIVAAPSALDEKLSLQPFTQEIYDCYASKFKNAELNDWEEEKYTCYVGIIINKNGDLVYMEPYEKDKYGFHKLAIDILENCNFKFEPGKIDGNAVSSFNYLPLTFQK